MVFSENLEMKSPKRRSLKIRHLTTSAPHNLKVGGPRAHFNSNIHHLDVKNDVRSLETKFACSRIMIRVRVRVTVTLRLTVGQFVCLGVEPLPGLMTRY
jgi:hypothetical protein